MNVSTGYTQKPRKIQRIVFSSVCKPYRIFPDGPEITILPGSDFKIAFRSIGFLFRGSWLCFRSVPLNQSVFLDAGIMLFFGYKLLFRKKS